MSRASIHDTDAPPDGKARTPPARVVAEEARVGEDLHEPARSQHGPRPAAVAHRRLAARRPCVDTGDMVGVEVGEQHHPGRRSGAGDEVGHQLRRVGSVGPDDEHRVDTVEGGRPPSGVVPRERGRSDAGAA
jgi:hypothetical protein